MSLLLNTLLLHTEYSGADFNKYHKQNGTKFYKFLRNDLTHFDFKYQLGLNTDTKPFNPTNECSAGGLYFCQESDCQHHYRHYGTKLALIEIPDDARVYVEDHKFKSDKIIIKEIIDFDKVDDSFWINIIMSKDEHDTISLYNMFAVQYVKKQSDELCMFVIEQNGCMLRYIKEQFRTEKICIVAVKQNYYALEHVINQTDEMCILAVQKHGNVLQFVKNQTDEICKLAVQENGYALCWVKNQTFELCELAVQQNNLALQYVKDDKMRNQLNLI